MMKETPCGLGAGNLTHHAGGTSTSVAIRTSRDERTNGKLARVTRFFQQLLRNGWPWAAALAVLGCAPHGGSGGSAEPPVRPQGPLGLEAAREYVLRLVNHDRNEAGLDPVERDEVAEKAGQRHVDDMVEKGYTAHWGSDGSVPEQRYTEAGGSDFVQENAACFFDGQVRTLDPNPSFDPALLEQVESAFIHEQPPNDGHRKNILKKWHNRVGIGLAKPEGVNQPCMSQEFVDAYGEYDGIPQEARVGQNLSVAGEVHKPAEFGGVGLARIDKAKPLGATHLNSTGTYPVPDPYVVYFPQGYKTPKPVKVEGNRFSIDVGLNHGGPGRYEVSVWARYPGNDAFVMVSLRTVDVH
jgi:uncharacterized protein YkwD